MDNEKILAELQKTNNMLNALLAIIVDQYIRSTDIAKPKARSIDRMLSDNGLSNTEIATLLGKTTQAVGQILNADKKAKKTLPAKQTSKSNQSEIEQAKEVA